MEMERKQQDPAQPAKVIDPVCGMKVDAAQPRGGTHVHDGRTYAFCNPRCREKFAASPEQYLAQRGQAQEAHEGHGAAEPAPSRGPAHEGHDALRLMAPAPPAAEPLPDAPQLDLFAPRPARSMHPAAPSEDMMQLTFPVEWSVLT